MTGDSKETNSQHLQSLEGVYMRFFYLESLNRNVLHRFETDPLFILLLGNLYVLVCISLLFIKRTNELLHDCDHRVSAPAFDM